MAARDELLIDLINRTEMEGTGPRLTVVAHGVVLTGRLTAHRSWAVSVADRLDDDSAPDELFGEAFRREADEPLAYPPVFLHLHGCQLISGSSSLPAALGEYFRVPLESVTAWSVR
ncbi:hypothetical protein [Streptomyces sp. 4F14]|uniref:hypothetical protein n=1 Tax=Streptomyces sp. 4F14 TaxID=3394380 RepID=UPI003A85BDA8